MKRNPWETFRIPDDMVDQAEPVLVIVKTHLCIEAFLFEIVAQRVAFPAHLPDRIAFHALVGFAIALGGVPEEAKEALLKINAFRNRLAHNLDETLSVADAETFRLLTQRIATVTANEKLEALSASGRIAWCACLLQAWLAGYAWGGDGLEPEPPSPGQSS